MMCYRKMVICVWVLSLLGSAICQETNDPPDNTAQPTIATVIPDDPDVPVVSRVTNEEPNNYIVYDKAAKIPCLKALFTGSLAVTYLNTEDDSTSIQLQVPDMLMVTGVCGETRAVLTLLWGGQHSQSHNLTFIFATQNGHPPEVNDPLLQTNTGTWTVDSIIVRCNMTTEEFIDPKNADKVQVEKSNPDDNYFKTQLGKAYSCDQTQSIVLQPDADYMAAEDIVVESVQLDITQMMMQPFQLNIEGNFTSAEVCTEENSKIPKESLNNPTDNPSDQQPNDQNPTGPPTGDNSDLSTSIPSNGSSTTGTTEASPTENSPAVAASTSHVIPITVAVLLCVIIAITVVVYYYVRRNRKSNYQAME